MATRVWLGWVKLSDLFYGVVRHVAIRLCGRSGDVCVVCVCVFFPFILDIKFVGRTSRGHRYFQHTHFIPIVGVGKRGEY